MAEATGGDVLATVTVLERLAHEGTEGPWEAFTPLVIVDEHNDVVAEVVSEEPADVAFIVGARNAVPAVRDRLERLERVAAAARGRHRPWPEFVGPPRRCQCGRAVDQCDVLAALRGLDGEG